MIDTSERALFAETVAKVFERTPDGTDHDVDGDLAAVGWHDALAAWGGPAIGIVLGAQGRAGATSGAIDDVVGSALGLEASQAVILPRLGAHEPPATAGARVVVDGTATARVLRAERAAVVVRGPDGLRVHHLRTDRLTVEPIRGLDPDAHLCTVTAEVPHEDLDGGSDADWSYATALGRLALASELVGVGRAMLDLAVEHATSRVQFGRTIGSFQAVRHRLAEAFVALEGASAAAEACGDATPLRPSEAAMTKALAGTAARTAARHAQQVLAGIGFTAEHPFHRSFRRTLLLDRILGSSRSLVHEVGEITLATRRVPMDLPL
ncbi:acyl-CoA dehydrogenase family protein [Mumia sp. DW29H23]|uniref:acyl-CoA dehydrogenase family protein n=1 Tax=Mumia sp. DW29H23 TaxID=3421241 RepID=UPI003D68911C